MTANAALLAVLLVPALLGIGYLGGRHDITDPTVETVYVAAPSGQWTDVPVRITTGDGTTYRYVCTYVATQDDKPEHMTCEWPRNP